MRELHRKVTGRGLIANIQQSCVPFFFSSKIKRCDYYLFRKHLRSGAGAQRCAQDLKFEPQHCAHKTKPNKKHVEFTQRVKLKPLSLEPHGNLIWIEYADIINLTLQFCKYSNKLKLLTQSRLPLH